jgi:hypothetical protein
MNENQFDKLRGLSPDDKKPVVVGRIIEAPAGELRLLDERGKPAFFDEEGYDHFAPWEVV